VQRRIQLVVGVIMERGEEGEGKNWWVNGQKCLPLIWITGHGALMAFGLKMGNLTAFSFIHLRLNWLEKGDERSKERGDRKEFERERRWRSEERGLMVC
jgi:hypothetical protein